jgi:hypothetical protein
VSLTVHAAHDPGWYATGVKITDQQMDQIPLTRHDWHGERNYTISQACPVTCVSGCGLRVRGDGVRAI